VHRTGLWSGEEFKKASPDSLFGHRGKATKSIDSALADYHQTMKTCNALLRTARVLCDDADAVGGSQGQIRTWLWLGAGLAVRFGVVWCGGCCWELLALWCLWCVVFVSCLCRVCAVLFCCVCFQVVRRFARALMCVCCVVLCWVVQSSRFPVSRRSGLISVGLRWSVRGSCLWAPAHTHSKKRIGRARSKPALVGGLLSTSPPALLPSRHPTAPLADSSAHFIHSGMLCLIVW
jgi:hypothetical protein